MIDRTKQRVVCAAIMKHDVIVCGPRHFDETMHTIIRLLPFDEGHFRDAEQGFVDQRGRFLTREQAFTIAADEGQIIEDPNIPGHLFSEDLY